MADGGRRGFAAGGEVVLAPTEYEWGNGGREEGETMPPGCACTTREKPSSSAGFGPISSTGATATNKALQLTYSSSAGATRATTTSFSSSMGKNPRYYYQRGFFLIFFEFFLIFFPNFQISELF